MHIISEICSICGKYVFIIALNELIRYKPWQVLNNKICGCPYFQCPPRSDY